MKYRLMIALLLGVVAAAGCASAPHELSVEDVTGPQSWGSASNVMHLSRLYFADQPDEQGLQAARANGVTTVINLRSAGETTFDGASAAREAGLAYFEVPVSPAGASFDRAAFQRISALVAARPDETILVHCSSGNRAGAWLAAHLVEDHGMSVDAALPIARRAGMTRDDVEARVRRYLGAAAQP
jgi:protein tyrosine phosphatase (PTP) superfamily phosphohydrolase (DUF442 family)